MNRLSCRHEQRRLYCNTVLIALTVSLPAYPQSASSAPRIINIVNFIRLLEPRDPAITRDVLYKTVVDQIALMRKHKLRGTFLLQYDALIDPRYQALLKSLPRDSFDIGAWWELPQPLIEKAGLPWRGRYPWDWRANIGFSTGYTPRERERLIDTYMTEFNRIFGYYPESVASWFIDAHSLDYMYRKYHIVASANCKDQYGTDGYTLWGGYWNQAYYPSKINSYMPAQHADRQIPVPIFRMLGSDPVRQYDNGLGHSRQGVVTLEPVYAFGGGDSTWVDWFFKTLTSGNELGFNYTQAGQENSFTWAAMAKGLELQFPLIARLRDEQRLQVQTLAESGRWFKNRYSVTPATTFTVTKDIPGSDQKTLWFDSRFYRINLLWEDHTLRIRDWHLFDENLPSVYEKTPATANECSFFTLPLVEGYLWSKSGQLAGLRAMAILDGKTIPLQGDNPEFQPIGDSTMQIRWPLTTAKGALIIKLKERQIEISWPEAPADIRWFFELRTADSTTLPFTRIEPHTLEARFEKINIASLQKKDSSPIPSAAPPGASTPRKTRSSSPGDNHPRLAAGPSRTLLPWLQPLLILHQRGLPIHPPDDPHAVIIPILPLELVPHTQPPRDLRDPAMLPNHQHHPPLLHNGLGHRLQLILMKIGAHLQSILRGKRQNGLIHAAPLRIPLPLVRHINDAGYSKPRMQHLYQLPAPVDALAGQPVSLQRLLPMPDQHHPQITALGHHSGETNAKTITAIKDILFILYLSP